jgi:hypothetical protein
MLPPAWEASSEKTCRRRSRQASLNRRLSDRKLDHELDRFPEQIAEPGPSQVGVPLVQGFYLSGASAADGLRDKPLHLDLALSLQRTGLQLGGQFKEDPDFKRWRSRLS